MVCDDIVGFGIIQPLIDDKDVTDIYINGIKEIIYEKLVRENASTSIDMKLKKM